MAYETTKIVKTLRFPGDDNTQYQINAVALESHTWAEIEERFNTIETFDALRYMGVISSSSLPVAECGDVYKIGFNGDLFGVPVEPGDMIICNTDNTPVNTPANWDIIQTNIDVEAILDHTHTGTVNFSKTAKTLSHTVTPTKESLTGTFNNGSASVNGGHGHTASGSVTFTPSGSIEKTSLTPAGNVKLTSPASPGQEDVTLKPSGSVETSSESFVTSVTVDEHEQHNHSGTATSAGGFTPGGNVTVDEYTPEGSVSSHKHNVQVNATTATQEALSSVTTTYTQGATDYDGILTIGTDTTSATYVNSVTVTEDSISPDFTGTAKAPTATFKGTTVEGHTHTLSIDNATIAAHTVTAPTSTHDHTFTGNDMYVHAAFTGIAAEHTHDFTGAESTQNVEVTVNNHTGNFTGTASGDVQLNVDKVLTDVTIENHSISTVDSGTFTTSAGTANE